MRRYKRSCNEQDDSKHDERSKLEAGSLNLSVSLIEEGGPDDLPIENAKLLRLN